MKSMLESRADRLDGTWDKKFRRQKKALGRVTLRLLYRRHLLEEHTQIQRIRSIRSIII